METEMEPISPVRFQLPLWVQAGYEAMKTGIRQGELQQGVICPARYTS